MFLIQAYIHLQNLPSSVWNKTSVQLVQKGISQSAKTADISLCVVDIHYMKGTKVYNTIQISWPKSENTQCILHRFYSNYQ